MFQPWKSEIEDYADENLRRAWRFWADHAHNAGNVLAFLDKAPQIIVRSVLGFCLEEPNSLSLKDLQKLNVSPGRSVAGFFDREAKRVVVLRDSRPEVMRFTLAHEIGHLCCHPDLVLNRERSINGAEQLAPDRPFKEKQADAFAAAVLMPPRFLESLFLSYFGDNVDGRNLNPRLSQTLSSLNLRSELRTDPLSFVRKGEQYRAFVIAQAVGCNGRSFVSLAEHFKVSATAMAIRLRELGLVL